MATVFTLRGYMMGLRYDYLPEYFGGALIGSGDVAVPVMYKQSLFDPIEVLLEAGAPALLGVDVQTGLDDAVAMLDAALTATAGEKIVVGHSEGALVAAKWLHDIGPTSPIWAGELSFILISNPTRKYGGAVYSTAYAVPDVTPYTVLDICNQYDTYADWPSDLDSLGVILAALNAMAGVLTTHINYFDRDLNDPDALTLTEGNITYVLLPTYPVPIIDPIPLELVGIDLYDNPIARQIDAVLRPIIELAYDRPFGLKPPEVFEYTYTNISDCADPDHFYLLDGRLTPQPWMQLRRVATKTAKGASRDYTTSNPNGGGFLSGVPFLSSVTGSAGGIVDQFSGFGGFDFSQLGAGGPNGAGIVGAQNKNVLIHTVDLEWTNLTPLPHWCYGLITRGGCRVTLQARSRAYLALWSGYAVDADAGDLKLASTMGCGADLGRAGTLSIGTGFAVVEQRQNTLTIPLAPERCGWCRLEPGETITARVELRFTSDVWESSMIDGGNSETESGYQSGDTRLDLFAVPIFGEVTQYEGS